MVFTPIMVMPRAKALSSESTTPSTATERLMTVLLTSFSPNSTRSQKLARPVRYSPCGRLSGPLLAYSVGALKALIATMKNGKSITISSSVRPRRTAYLPRSRRIGVG